MSVSILAAIDWSCPWLQPFRELAEPIVNASDWRQAINAVAEERGVKNHRNLPLHFVSQSDLPSGMAYETFISETGYVPTRDNLHDFFNALVWLLYPRTKARVNELQAKAIKEMRGVTAIRGSLRDGLTLFDENGVFFFVQDERYEIMLRERKWKELLLDERHAFGSGYAVYLFGHALIEKLVRPYKGITAHVWICRDNRIVRSLSMAEQQDAHDRMVALSLTKKLSTKDFLPLPVLGLPEWASGQDEQFYADVKVFRGLRTLG